VVGVSHGLSEKIPREEVVFLTARGTCTCFDPKEVFDHSDFPAINTNRSIELSNLLLDFDGHNTGSPGKLIDVKRR
jgi:hypothetical protein